MPADINKTTRFEYNLDGNLVKLIAENPTTGDQVTEWIYGVTVAQGSALESKALVYQKKYPDSAGAADRVTYTYNRQGQVVTMKDQAGTTHGYAFDKFGRILEDAASFVPSSPLDKTVQKIARTYEIRGALEKVTSWGLDGTVPVLRNEVLLTYNAYGQLARDYQEHSGAANTATSLFVSYSYADGSANTVRRTGITYPQTETPPTSATTITTEYGGAAADALSRPDALKEGSATLCSYRYLGAGVFIGVKYDAASDVQLTYEDGGTGDAGDKYTGLDRFGRLIETLWKKGTAAQVHSQYGRNRFGGITWRKDLAAHSLGVTTEDNFYQYDGLYQVKEHQRGNLTGTTPSGIVEFQFGEDWTYDATGNWQAYSKAIWNGMEVEITHESRTNNVANEITQITNSGGNINPAYDPVGNMRTMPTAPGSSTGQYSLKWDAWNRLVEVKDGGTLVASYGYDGLTRRLTKTNATESRHYFYNENWRAVEERVPGAAVVVDRQYAWGLRDRWDLLRGKRSTGGNSLNEVHFCLRDYLDPMAIAGTDGLVKERIAYDAFGNVRFLAPDYSIRMTSSFEWEFLFHAEFRDVHTMFYNYGFRFYSTNLGRWLSLDPLEEGGNFWVFVRNRPTTNFDIIGLTLSLQSEATTYDVTVSNGSLTGIKLGQTRPGQWDASPSIEDVGENICFLHMEGSPPQYSITIDAAKHMAFYPQFALYIEMLNRTRTHEFKHVTYLKRAWNTFANFANSKEGHYCPCGCAHMMASIIGEYMTECRMDSIKANATFDMLEYGIDYGGDMSASLAKIYREADRKFKEANKKRKELEKEFKAVCSKSLQQ